MIKLYMVVRQGILGNEEGNRRANEEGPVRGVETLAKLRNEENLEQDIGNHALVVRDEILETGDENKQ